MPKFHELKYFKFALNFLVKKNPPQLKLLLEFCSFHYEPKAALGSQLTLSPSAQID
jgi:hypothetical protein